MTTGWVFDIMSVLCEKSTKKSKITGEAVHQRIGVGFVCREFSSIFLFNIVGRAPVFQSIVQVTK